MCMCLRCTILFICFISLCAAVASSGKKSKKTYKSIIAVCIINCVSLVYYNLFAPAILSLDIGLVLLLFYLISIIAGLIYIITAIVCGHKIKKSGSKDKLIEIPEGILEERPEILPEDAQEDTKEEIPHNKHFAVAASAVVLLPILIFSFVYFKELYLIRNSDLILCYTSRGNGGFGDSHSFAYAVNDNYCKEFDIGADFGGYQIEKFLPKNMTKFYGDYKYGKQSFQVDDYYIEIGDIYSRSLVIYKNDELLHQVKYSSNYFNIECESIYYRP